MAKEKKRVVAAPPHADSDKDKAKQKQLPGAERDDFALEAQSVPADALKPKPKQTALRLQGAAPRSTRGGAKEEARVLSYRHQDKRKNNPQVGLVNEANDPQQPKTEWRYDPHIDPALQFDVGRAQIEKLIDDALAVHAETGDYAAMRAALEELKRAGSPYLNWTGKADGWKKLKRDIRAELDEAQLDKFHGTVSLPFEAGDNRKVAVKIVDDRGIESLKVIPLN